jgi:hypothetical protein
METTDFVRTPEGPDPEEQYARYASQRPTILPKIGSANGDANGSQLGSSTGSDNTALKLGRRSPLRARSMEGLPCCIGKDLTKIDPGRGSRCGRKRLQRDARTNADGDDNCDRELLRDHDPDPP